MTQTQYDLVELKINEGVTFEGSFEVTWGKQTFTFPQHMTIDFDKYFQTQSQRTIAAGKKYTMPRFIPKAVVIDLAFVHPLALLSNFTSQATPILKRFFNVFTNNFASQEAVDLAIVRVIDSLRDGSCHARIAKGETKTKHFRPQATDFASFVLIKLFWSKFAKLDFDIGFEKWNQLRNSWDKIEPQLPPTQVETLRTAWEVENNSFDVANILNDLFNGATDAQ